MPTPELRLEAYDLWKTYQEGPTVVHAVRGVSLQVAAGRVLLLMGPSGSGKSTLLSMLGCILKPSGGELRVLGRPVEWDERHLPQLRRESLGFVFQGFNLLASLTAAENVALPLRLKGQKRDALERGRLALESVGLGHRWNFLPRDLSGGEKQRVAVARAIVGDPPIVLADEPTGNLDSANGRIVVELLRRVAVEQHRTVVIVTHDARIVPFADEVVTLDDGAVAEHRRAAAGASSLPRVMEAY